MLRPALKMLAVLWTGLRNRLPGVLRLVQRGEQFQAWSLSLAALYSRRFGARAIVWLGVLASAYALYLYAMHAIAPDAPKASHDVVLKTRWSGPAPGQDIVIVDIDERSLAALAGRHGRWPWPRDVLADGLQKLEGLGVRAVLFGVMMSDPDKFNPDADAAMDAAAQMSPFAAFPLIRLDAQNDARSQLAVARLPGAVAGPGARPEATLAAVLPLFAGMQERLGVANQAPDEDGIVRKYRLRWDFHGYQLPSQVLKTLEVGSAQLAPLPEQMALNWRNKKGRYTRLSFSDLLDGPIPEALQAQLKGSYVVLGVSAPGLGPTRPTAVAAIEDDNEILATALDDALRGSYLRVLPAWGALAINLLTIWGLVWVSLRPALGEAFNRVFVLLQSGLGGITLLSASYTNYLIDLSDSMSFGLSVFALIKLIQSMDDRWSRARPGFRRLRRPGEGGQVLVLAYTGERLPGESARELQGALEGIVGHANVVRIDDLFGGESFVRSACARFRCVLVHATEPQRPAIEALLAQAAWQAVERTAFELDIDWDPEQPAFAREMAPRVLDCAARLLQPEPAAPVAA